MNAGITHAMLLAAGKGTRMRPLTDTLPKPLVPVAGRPLIDHALTQAKAAGIETAVVNMHHLAPLLSAHMKQHEALNVILSDETDMLLETGGGVVRALPHLGHAPFVVMNSDAVWTEANALHPLMQHWRGEEMDALLLLTRREDAIGYTRRGDFFLEEGRLVRRGQADQAPYVFTGAQILKPEVFEGCAEEPFSLNIIWDMLIARGRAYGIVGGGQWCDVGTPEGRDLAEAALNR